VTDLPPALREYEETEARHRPLVGAVVALGCATVLVLALLGLPDEHAPLPAIARYALEISLPVWHLTEPVNVVVYGTRGFDTFGETFLLLAAVVAVVVLTRTKERRRGFLGEEVAARAEQEQYDARQVTGDDERAARLAEDAERGGGRLPATPDSFELGTPAPERAQGMSVVVRTGIRVVAPILTVGGLYLVSWGFSPGGGFPGGAVLLGVVLLVYAAFGYRRVRGFVRPGLIEPIELAFALAICALGLVGLAVEGSFWANWIPLAPAETIRSGGIAQAFSVAELAEVALGLSLAVFSLLGMRHDWAPDTSRSRARGARPKEEPGKGERE
jgi:multicomponent Na+:H+ antiporter subunit B